MYIQEEFMGRRVLKSSLLDGEDVIAFFTTRDLPLKAGEREDLIEEIENNKKLVCEGLGIGLEDLVIPVQTHSSNVAIVEGKGKKEQKRGQDAWMSRCVEGNNHASTPLRLYASYNSSPPHLLTSSPYDNTDALIASQSQIALALNFADCVPLIFYDPVKKIIASAHAGWKGTAAKIGVKTVQKMVNKFGCEAKDIIALIGPAIGRCCFEVKDDVKKQLLETIDKSNHPQLLDENNLDLKLINKFQLLAIGVKKIDVCEYCTSCQNELFFSYRKENGNCARHSAVIMMGAN